MNIKGSTLIRATNADVAEDGTATIPNGVTSIGNWAFNGCTSLREIQSQGKIQKVVCIDGYVMTVERRRTIGETEYIDGKILIRYDNGRWKTEKCTAAMRDGVSAHGETARIALRDLKFKLAERRGAEQYENVGLDDVFSLDDMISMYRVITGACAFGVNQFIGGLNTVKERYTPREVIELTQNEYGGRAFREFFVKKGVDVRNGTNRHRAPDPSGRGGEASKIPEGAESRRGVVFASAIGSRLRHSRMRTALRGNG